MSLNSAAPDRGVQVANELGQDPRLVRVADSPVPLLDQGLGADLAPRQMMQADLPQLALVDGQRMLAWRAGQWLEIVRTALKPCSRATSRYDSTCAAFSSFVLSHLNQSRPQRRSALYLEDSVGRSFLSPLVNGTSM